MQNGHLKALLRTALLFALLATGCREAKPAPDAKVGNPALRADLLSMLAPDRSIRLQIMTQMEKTGAKLTIPMLWLALRMTLIDRSNTARLRGIVDKYGWPDESLVGQDGASAAFLLVQHADRNPAFQKQCLPLLQAAAERGEASKSDMAMLTDRVLVAEHQKQLYGTQCKMKDSVVLVDPIEDSVNVDQRRAGVGLCPLSTYVQVVTYSFRHADALDKPGTPVYDSLDRLVRPFGPDGDSAPSSKK